MLKRFLGVAFLCLLAAPTYAQTQAWNENVLTWAPHTTCSDGSPATNCPVDQWRLETAATATATTWDLVGYVPAATLRYVHTSVAAGPHCYRVKGATGNFTTAASAVLPNSCKTNVQPPPPTPTPPGPVTVANVTAYEVKPNSTGTMVASRIGLVPAGTVCSQETRTAPLNSRPTVFNRIDPATVDLINWPSAVPPTEVFARCAAG